MRTHQYLLAGGALIAGLALSGCGGGKDEAEIAAPPPSMPAVSLTATPDPAALPVGAPGAAAPGVATPLPGGATSEGPTDIFKGMSPQQIEEFKATTTLESHDMNLNPLNEAINGYVGEFKRIPANQEELVKTKYLPKVLHAPKGKKYVIDQTTGEVTVQ